MRNGEAAGVVLGMTNAFLIVGFPNGMPAHEITQWADHAVNAGLILSGLTASDEDLDALEEFATNELMNPTSERFALKGKKQLQAIYAAEATSGGRN